MKTGARIVLAAAALVALACDDEGTGTADRVPPQVTIVDPAEGERVNTTQPGFLIRVSDDDTGVSCESIRATFGGSDASGAFRAGCSPLRGEVRIPADQNMVILTVGEHTLVFRISDGAGNEATATRTFTVREPLPEPEE